MNHNNTIIVGRHGALVTWIKNRIGHDAPVLEHVAEMAQVAGKDVYGVLPLHLAAAANSVTIVAMTIPPERRGTELSIEEMDEFGAHFETFEVNQVAY